MGGASYQYDGLNNRVQQTVGANVTKYLLDLQPGLSVVLAETTGANVIRNVHSPRGIHAHKDAAGAWEWIVQDGLGSVRGVVDNNVSALWSGSTAPYGEYFGETGTRQTNYGFTGEYTDPTTGLVHLRARDYNPALGVFISLDPFEGKMCRPMSLNGYSWVEGQVPNAVDPGGNCLTGLDNACNYCFYGSPGYAITTCLAQCNDAQRNAALDGIFGYLAREYYGFRFDASLPYGNTEQAECNDTTHPNTRGVYDFVGISNEVARLTNDVLDNYLYVMNTVLLQYPTSGDFMMYFTQGAVSYSFRKGFCIGSVSLDEDFNDRTPNQISTHIWAAIATTASPQIPDLTPELLLAANFFHEIIETGSGSNWEDFISTFAAGDLGMKLRSGEIKPSEFGQAFQSVFSNPLSHTYPGAKSKVEMQNCLPLLYIQQHYQEIDATSLRVVASLLNKPGALPCIPLGFG